ncbi:hypothetical protein BGX27_008686 [Mortierella sp. AM989]|nr:hypothetical protein BGX27_008686 [Mortierella sp. AM989]
MNNSKKTSLKDPKPSNTLSSIVSDLVRAAIGGNHNDVPDEDLDKYVADMIMKSASKTEKQYQSVGLKAYTSPNDENKARLDSGVIIDRSDSNGLKTNKRFLSSIIKSTDDHNQALIRAEEKKATEMAKELIADLDRRVADRERLTSRGRDFRKGGRSSSSRMRMDDIQQSSSSNSRSTSLPRKDRRSISRSTSPSPAPSEEVKVRGRGSRKYDLVSSNTSPSVSQKSKLGSKMDRYFQDGYDPSNDSHPDDDKMASKKHKKKEKKDRKSKEDRDHDRRRHKKHKSDKSRKSSSRKSSHRYESDSEDSGSESDTGRRHKNRHSSSSRRRHNDKELSDDERKKSRSNQSKNKRKHSSRSPSPIRSKHHKSSHKSSRSSKEEEPSKHKRRRDHTPTSDSGSDGEESDDSEYFKSKRSRSQTPPSSRSQPLPQPAAREWDLHKINKESIRNQIFVANKKDS